MSFAGQLVLGTLDRLTLVDELLSEASENCPASDERGRPQHLEACHLELLDRPDIPPSVSLNEAIDV